ncbi:MAG: helix-turn-helix domain-containing protein [Oceanipulchritudo sp.]
MPNPSTHLEPARPRATREIFLVLPRNLGPNREIMRGIYEFAYPAHRWVMFFVDQTPEAILSLAKKPTAAGVIGQFGRADLAEAALQLRIPVVSVHGGLDIAGLCHVGIDRIRQGAFAAEWFLENGFPHMGFYGLAREPFSEAQFNGYAKRLKKAKKEVLVLNLPSFFVERSRRPDPHPALEWLAGLPKPVALYCPNDILANELSTFCLQLQLAVPRDVAILGSGNDELLCLGSLPPLSSIRLPHREVGLKAAAMLEDMLQGKRPNPSRILIDQPDVLERQSTLLQHAGDPHVERALQWMREHAAHGINVEGLARAAGLSVRSLETRFQKSLGRSPKQELNRLRLEEVKRLLREHDHTLEQIADKCGFSSGIYLSQFFRRETGTTPGNYRKTFRA